MLEIRRYIPKRADEWNAFVSASKNGTFLFNRRYMDYHSDRFCDHSLMFYRNGRLYAVLPANEKEHVFYTHQGLTYGGLVMGQRCSASGIIECFETLNAYLRNLGVEKVLYKAVPWIYHQLPAEEDLYALTQVCGAHLLIRDISSVVVGHQSFSESRKSGVRKALRRGYEVRESDDTDAFWHILDSNLWRTYRLHPVHSAGELRLLKDRFPREIRLFMTFDGAKPLGGTLLFITPQVIHTQYISADEEGKANGAIDLLFDQLIHKEFTSCRYIDFGKSTSTDSAVLNSKLIFQKEGFGGRAVCYDTYEWDL